MTYLRFHYINYIIYICWSSLLVLRSRNSVCLKSALRIWRLKKTNRQIYQKIQHRPHLQLNHPSNVVFY